jgi:hypothetical protein
MHPASPPAPLPGVILTLCLLADMLRIGLFFLLTSGGTRNPFGSRVSGDGVLLVSPRSCRREKQRQRRGMRGGGASPK